MRPSSYLDVIAYPAVARATWAGRAVGLLHQLAEESECACHLTKNAIGILFVFSIGPAQKPGTTFSSLGHCILQPKGSCPDVQINSTFRRRKP